MTTRNPIILQPGEGEYIDVVGDRYRFLANASDTAGSYGIWEAVVPPGGGPPPHRHAREDEGFYIIEGELTIHIDGTEIIARAGAFINLPRGSVHCFRNHTDRTTRLLILVAPGGFEAMFRQTGTPVKKPDDPITPISPEEIERLKQTAPDYGVEILLPESQSQLKSQASTDLGEL